MKRQGKDIGNRLRTAREQAGVSLRHIADSTKLSMHNLTLLEQERVDELPGGIYRRAIVRTYAAEVGLDPEQTLRTFLASYPDDVPRMEDVFPPPSVVRARRIHTILSALGALIPLLAGVFYLAMSARAAETPRHRTERQPPAVQAAQPAVVPASFTERGFDPAAAARPRP
jgi:cytoskeletal protein RodZ